MKTEELRERIARSKPRYEERSKAAPFILWFVRKQFDAMTDEQLMEQWAMFEVERGD